MGRVLPEPRVPRLRARNALQPAGNGDLLSRRLDPRRKVVSLAGARRWRAAQRGTVAFTNGVFDLLHPGHVDVLVAASKSGVALIVGVNSDASVRRLQKSLVARPIQRVEDRAMMVASLACVDRVVIFDEDTPLEVILALRPNVIVKGGDYSPATVVGAEEAKAWKGTVKIVPITPGYSTTSTISRIVGHSGRISG